MSNVYDLFMSEQEPDAKAQAQAMAQALMRDRKFGNLAQLTGDKVLAPFGQSLVSQAGQQEGLLGNVGQHRSGQRMTLRRDADSRTFSAGEADKQRGFTGKQNSLDRGLRREQMNQQLELDRSRAEREGKSNAVKIESDLRDKYLGYEPTKRINIARTASNIVAGASPNGAGDMRLVYGYVQLLDPGSMVKEGEFKAAAETGGLPGKAQGWWNTIRAQGFLTDDIRAQIKAEAQRMMATHATSHKPIRDSFSALAQQYGVDPARVVVDLGVEGLPDPSAAATGGAQSGGANDAAALKWAQENPTHPYAAEILRLNGQAGR